MKEELAAEHETASPEHDELNLTSRALGLVRDSMQVIQFHQADRLDLFSRFKYITKSARFKS